MLHLGIPCRLFAALTAGLVWWAPPAVAAEDGPPLEDGWYVDRGACPGELCAMGEWVVRRDTALYDRPFGDRAVGIARIDETVATEEAIAYTIPMRLIVIHPVDYPVEDLQSGQGVTVRLEVGMTIDLLTPEGEGYQKAWVDGRLVSVDGSEFMDFDSYYPNANGYRGCDVPSPDCWWRMEFRERLMESEFWVRMRLPDGTVGWTAESGRFISRFALEKGY